MIVVFLTLKKARSNFRKQRLKLRLTQEGLSNRSGVKLATLQKFERTGKLSLPAFMELAVVLDYLGPLNEALDPITAPYQTIDDVLAPPPKQPKRGWIK